MTYIVCKGDTLSKIAKMFGTTVGAIAALNGITNVNIINVGQVLDIPTLEDVKDYAAIGEKVEEVLEDIAELPSFQALLKML